MVDWKPGDIAICINDRFVNSTIPSPLLLGTRYTVIDVYIEYSGISPIYNAFGEAAKSIVCLKLLEAKNPWSKIYGLVDGFDQVRFEKEPPLVDVEEEERDIDLILEICQP